MFSAFMISLREGVEISIILAVILAYLKQLDRREVSKQVWLGTVAAGAFSVLIAAGIYRVMGAGESNFQVMFEGVLKILAVIILTWMTFWMKRQSKDMSGELKQKIDQALKKGSIWALTSLAFISVVREGIETALFILGSIQENSPSQTILGMVIGFGVAAILGVLIYKGTHRLSLKSFFTVLSVLLIFMGAGLLTGGIHEFQELSMIPEGIEHVWNLQPILSDTSLVGGLLKAVFGYRESPNLVLVVAYGVYLMLALFSYFKPAKA